MKKSAPGRSRKSTADTLHLTNFRRVWIIFIVAATSAPYLINWWQAPAGYHYTWILPPYPEDSFGYMAWAAQAAHGAWLFKIKFTALPHTAFLFHPLFLVCGWLSGIFSCELGIVFLFVKAVGVALFFTVLFRYLDYLGLNRRQSIAATVFVGISSGVGVLLLLGGVHTQWAKMSTDLWMPEISTFWSLMWNPLFPFSLTLLLLSIWWLDRGTRDGNRADLWRSGGAAALMALLHPYSVPVVFAFAVIVTIVRRKRQALGYLARYFAIALPFAVYMGALSRLNPLLARHSAAGEMKSPAIIEFATGLGLLLILFFIGLAIFRSKLWKAYWQIVLWFFLAVLFAYFPFWFQRKLIFSAHIPLCIVSAIAFDSVLTRWFSERMQKWVVIAAACLFLPLLASTLGYLLVDENREVTANLDGAYLVNNEIIDGLKILKAQTKPDDVVLATPETSRFIPAFSGNTVVWGHWAMSVDFKERQAAIAKVLDMRSDLDDKARASEFWGSGIQIVFADGKMRESMRQFPLLWGVILKDARKIFENDAVVIFARGDR